jgi:D-inositol-3-phosphate glycosyltransferase
VPDGTILSPGVSERFLLVAGEAEPPPWHWRLLYVGRVVEQKGIETAIESLSSLPDEATLRIVGDGEAGYRGSLERLARTRGVTARVAFEPARPHEEMSEVYRDADAVVFPVRWAEPWGLVPLEAMALGRPVLATGRGGSGDYLRDADNALLFEAGDARALARSALRLADDPALRARLRAGGLRTARSHSEYEFNARALAEIQAACAAAAGGR